MITETRQTRTHVLHYEHHRPRRRHHTLDNATLDQFNFVCIPLRRDEVNFIPACFLFFRISLLHFFLSLNHQTNCCFSALRNSFSVN